MKHNNALLHGCLLAAGLTLLPFAAHATGLSNHFLAENSFTQSVKDGYQDIKKEVKETVDELTGDDKTDTQKFQERRDKDLKKYQKEVRDAQKDYAKKREKAQREYLKHHKQLPFQEDLQKDLESAPAPTTAKYPRCPGPPGLFVSTAQGPPRQNGPERLPRPDFYSANSSLMMLAFQTTLSPSGSRVRPGAFQQADTVPRGLMM